MYGKTILILIETFVSSRFSTILLSVCLSTNFDLSSLSIFSFQSTSAEFLLLVGSNGFEPSTSRLSGARSNQLSYEPISVFGSFPLSHLLPFYRSSGGDEGIRTLDPLLAGQVLSQLSYTPISYGEPLERASKIEQQIRLAALTARPVLHRKEVIQPHLPIRLPCYDLTPIIEPTFGCSLLTVRTQTSGLPDFHGLTGGVYKARERIHRGMLIRDY